jgi:hypothetical protein
MAGMYGSCCEEQEAQEAAFRSKIRAATAINENRMMHAHKVRQGIARSLRCGDACCMGCGDCEEEEEPSPEALAPPKRAVDGDADDDDDDDDDDDVDAVLMAKMRAQRMRQLQSSAEDQSKRRSAQGTHTRLKDASSLARLLADPSDSSPIVLHLAAIEEDGGERCAWVDDVMRKAAHQFPHSRLMTACCRRADEPPAGLEFLPTRLPSLLVVEKGVVTSLLGGEVLGESDEPEAVQDCAQRWLEGERRRLDARAASMKRRGGDDDDDDESGDEEGGTSFCGRPGCRAYPHEHVGSQAAGSAMREGDLFAR